MNKEGKVVISSNCIEASCFSGGLASVRHIDSPWNEGAWRFITIDGKTELPLKFAKSLDVSEGLAAVEKGNWGYVDTSGAWRITPQFLAVGSFSEGFAAVSWWDEVHQRCTYGYIDHHGETIIPPRMLTDTIGGKFSEGLAAVALGTNHVGRLGYIDRSGKPVIAPRFNIAARFHNGLARVEEWGKKGLINKLGNYVWIDS
jgi:hypothetical protein